MADQLISVTEAQQRAAAFMPIIRHVDTVPLRLAAGRILAANITAQIENPRFDQSAMDGYAVRSRDLKNGARSLRVAGRVAAGEAAAPASESEAVRIFTGAPLPDEFDAVIMQEHITREGSLIHVDRPVKPGDNIRRRGEDIARGGVLLESGQRLDARHIALLAGQGYADVAVFSRVRIAVISTGDELRQAGESLDDAEIYDSNRETVMALARAAGAEIIDGGSVRDRQEAITARINDLLPVADLIVTTGGASLGEEDHCADAFKACGGRIETLKIAMKPGKPAIVGRAETCAYLGLPGNPIAAIVVWWLLGEAMLEAAQGRAPRKISGHLLPSLAAFPHKAGRTEFLPARLIRQSANTLVEIIGRGGSARLLPLVQADGFVEIPAEHGEVMPGDKLEFRGFFGNLAV